jgi:hypothetical protein
MLLLRLFAPRCTQPTREKSPPDSSSWEWLLTKETNRKSATQRGRVAPGIRPTLKRRRSPLFEVP